MGVRVRVRVRVGVRVRVRAAPPVPEDRFRATRGKLTRRQALRRRLQASAQRSRQAAEARRS